MKNSIYWNIDSFGTILPENWEDIVEKANALITEYEEIHGKDAAAEYSENLWEAFCESGEIPTREEIEENKVLEDLDRKNYKTLSGYSVKFHVDMCGRYYYTIEDHSGICGPFTRDGIIEAL